MSPIHLHSILFSYYDSQWGSWSVWSKHYSKHLPPWSSEQKNAYRSATTGEEENHDNFHFWGNCPFKQVTVCSGNITWYKMYCVLQKLLNSSERLGILCIKCKKKKLKHVSTAGLAPGPCMPPHDNKGLWLVEFIP